jgi:hypothetical protein
MPADWFRRTTWTQEDERDFRARLVRARRENRAQYLRIQALTLAAADPPGPDVALALLDEMLREFPEPIELSSAHLQAGAIHEAAGDVEKALASYADAVAAMRAQPNVATDAPHAFGLLVGRIRREDLYAEAQAALDDFPPSLLPLHRFRHFAAGALIREARGETAGAATLAAAALAEADRDRASFRKHPDFGLVGPESAGLVARMRTLAGRPAALSQRVRSLFSKR